MRTADRFLAESRSWQAFFQKAASLPASAPGNALDKGKVFERLTQLYLKTHPEYQTRLKHVWRAKDELPPAIRSRIGLPRTDEGIDLVAETFEGEIWAIQSKFRSDTQKPLTVTELSTFVNLCFNVCRNVSLAVVAHTRAKPVKKVALLGKTTEIGLERWLELGAEDWRRILAATTKAPPPPEPRAPRPHQERAVASARKHFLKAGARRGRLIMPCGTGKSLTAFWIAEALKAHSILVAVPSLHLIKDSLAEWTREFLARGEVPEWLCVCSDESTGRLERDEFVGGVYDLGVDSTTDPKVIGEFLARRSRKRKIVFATYQSGKPLASAAQAARFAFDLGIMDEAHRTVGSPDKSFGHLLQDKNIRISKRLFMTATERIVRGAEEKVLSMDDPRVYGECFHQLTFKEAIEAKPPIISDYKILTITVSDREIREMIEQNRYLRTSDSDLGEREAQALAAGISLQRAFREEGVRHAISFHRSIRAAEDFKGQQEVLETSSQGKDHPAFFHISSKKTAGERADLLREFRASPSALITNARCLQEGVNIPTVDCVLFADPKQSVIDIVQAAGRAMRPCKGKRYGYIVVPIVVPSDVDFAEFAETTEFKQVARVVTALSTQDDRIAEEFRGVPARGRRRGDRIVEIKGNVPVAQCIDLNAFQEQVRLKIWERVGRLNWRHFNEAREYARGLGVKSQGEWNVLAISGQLPPDIPRSPECAYKDKGWAGIGDWLGTGTDATRSRRYLPFEEARAVVRTLGLMAHKDWRVFTKSGRLPKNIPAVPHNTYRAKGWVSYGDWLGTETIATRLRQYRPFEEAREFARNLHFKSNKEWRAFAKSGSMPSDIPTNPQRTYRDQGWAGTGDWLGTGAISAEHRKYKPFIKARRFAQNLRLQSGAEWRMYVKSGDLPPDIPAAPWNTYRESGWAGMGDWLGTGMIASQLRKFKHFLKARALVRKLGLKNQKDWSEFCKSERRPPDIPTNPNRVYKDKGWAGFGDWLGTGKIAPSQRKFRSFKEARNFVHGLHLTGQKGWFAFCKSGRKPNDIPVAPAKTYQDKGWAGWGDWLGTGTVAPGLRKYRPFDEAREYVRILHLKSFGDWLVFCKSGALPSDIPSSPSVVYLRNGWAGWGDWLGTGTRATRLKVFRPFHQARAFVRKLGLKSGPDWRVFCKSGSLPSDIPTNPHRTYRDKGWAGMGDWLGTGNIGLGLMAYRSFEDARAFARELHLKGQKDWRAFSKSGRRPLDIPSAPHSVYREHGWLGYGDWLGTGNVGPGLRQYKSFEEARSFARSLGLKSSTEWRHYAKCGKRPSDIPSNPDTMYREEGWSGYADWLGTK